MAEQEIKTQEKEPLFARIVNAVPELDLLFALARRTEISITFSINGVKQDMDVFIDSISVGPGERTHPSEQEFSNFWFIEGHFWGDGKKSWSLIFKELKGRERNKRGFTEELFDEIEVWGSFQGAYYKDKGIGEIQTPNYNKKRVTEEICPCKIS